MAIDYRSELRRPLPFSLAVIAAVLLIWLVVASIAGARQRTARDHRIQDLETQQTSLRGELDSQRQATGTLAALNTKIHAAETQGQQATQAGEQARAKALQVLPRSSRRRSAKRARRRQPSRRGPNAWAMCKLKSARPSRSLLRCVTLSSLPSKRRRLEPRNWPTSVVAWRRRVSRKPSFGLILPLYRRRLQTRPRTSPRRRRASRKPGRVRLQHKKNSRTHGGRLQRRSSNAPTWNRLSSA